MNEGFIVKGSGAVVEAYLERNVDHVNSTLPNLHKRATGLVQLLEGELRRQNVDTVGGLFQVLLFDDQGH